MTFFGKNSKSKEILPLVKDWKLSDDSLTLTLICRDSTSYDSLCNRLQLISELVSTEFDSTPSTSEYSVTFTGNLRHALQLLLNATLVLSTAHYDAIKEALPANSNEII